MAAYGTVDNDMIHASTAAGAEDLVTLNPKWTRVRIINRGTDPLFAREIGGAAIAASGEADTYVVLAGEQRVIPSPDPASSGARVFGDAITAYTVEGTAERG